MSNQSNKLDSSRFYTLSAVAWSSLEDIEESQHRFNKHLHYAFTGYRQLGMKYHPGVKTVEIEMEAWKQIKFPIDMVDWSKVGFRVGDQVKILTRDSKIPKIHNLINCVPQENKPVLIHEATTTDIITPFYGWASMSHQDQFFGSVLNYNYLGYFDVDWTRRVINFKEVVNGLDTVYLEYITDGINYDGATIIHPYLFDPLVNWIHWKRKFHDDKYSESAAREAERIYKNSLDELAVQSLELSLDDVREALRSGYRLTPKN